MGCGDKSGVVRNPMNDALPNVWPLDPDGQQDPSEDPRYKQNPKVIIKDSPIHGRGVFARVDIPAFTLIGRYQGEFTDEDGMHVLWLYDEDRAQWVGIDGENEMRFLNHSDDPNAEWSDIDLYATRWIAQGEEITFDYGWEDETNESVESSEASDASGASEHP